MHLVTLTSRSAALSEQASMLFVCLFFSQETLKNDGSTMREIVDKFFCDNWVKKYVSILSLKL